MVLTKIKLLTKSYVHLLIYVTIQIIIKYLTEYLIKFSTQS